MKAKCKKEFEFVYNHITSNNVTQKEGEFKEGELYEYTIYKFMYAVKFIKSRSRFGTFYDEKHFFKKDFDEYFINEQELRKLKLKQLNGKN